MAEAKESVSLHGLHDSVYDYNCTPCLNVNLNAEAIVYCKDCFHAFCSNCLKHHNKSKIGHRVLDRADIVDWGDVKPITPSMMCEDHPGKQLEMYCGDHDCVCCLVCTSVGHRSCNKLQHVDEAAKGIHQNREFKTLLSKAAITQLKLKELYEKREENKRLLLVSRKRIKSSCAELRKQFEDFINKLETESLEEMHRLLLGLENNIENDIDSLTEISVQLQRLLEDIQTFGKECETFAFEGFKKCQQILCKADKYITSLRPKDSVIEFTPDTQLERFMSSVKTFGTFRKVHISESQPCYKVMANDDQHRSLITGICQLPDGRIAIVDNVNKSVKMLSSSFSLASELKMASKPFDICHKSENELLVACNFQHKGEVVSLYAGYQNLTASRAMKFDHMCIAIAFNDHKLYLASPKRIFIYSKSGKFLKTIYDDETGCLQSLCISKDGSRVFVTDPVKESVLTFEDDGQNLKMFEGIRRPTGISVAPNGTIFVCSLESHSVYQIDSSGKSKIMIASRKNGLWKPHSLCYIAETNQLVGQMSESMMLIEVM